MTAKQVGNYLLIITLQEDNMNKRTLALAAVATLGLSTAAFAQNPDTLHRGVSHARSGGKKVIVKHMPAKKTVTTKVSS